MDRDALLQFYATYTLEKCLASGIARYIPLKRFKDPETRARAAVTPRRPRLLTADERRLVEEATAKGLMGFEDIEFQAAIVYVAAGLFIELDAQKFMQKLGAAGGVN